jgi:cytidylate kinase
MINLLTIEREYGSGAGDIAAKLSDRLGWRLWDQLLTDRIARRLQCGSQVVEAQQEKKDPLYYRLFKAFMRGSYEGTQNTQVMKIADAESIRRVSEQLVREAAGEGNAVIVGRGSAYYLKDRPDSFHVFIYAPFEERVRRLRQKGKTEGEAVQLAETVDLDRAAFIKQYFGIEWPSRQFFHMMVNSTMGDEAVVEMILDGLSVIGKK